MATKLLESVGPFSFFSEAMSAMNMAMNTRNFLNGLLPQGTNTASTPASTVASVATTALPAIANAISPSSLTPQDSMAAEAMKAMGQAYFVERLWSNLPVKVKVITALIATFAGWRMWQSVAGGGGSTTVVVHNHIYPEKHEEKKETETDPGDLEKLFSTIRPLRHSELKLTTLTT